MSLRAMPELRINDRIKPIPGSQELFGFANEEGRRTATVVRIDHDDIAYNVKYKLECGETREVVFPVEFQVQVVWGPYAVHYQYWDRRSVLHNRVREFDTEAARRRWIERQENTDSWYKALAFADPE